MTAFQRNCSSVEESSKTLAWKTEYLHTIERAMRLYVCAINTTLPWKSPPWNSDRVWCKSWYHLLIDGTNFSIRWMYQLECKNKWTSGKRIKVMTLVVCGKNESGSEITPKFWAGNGFLLRLFFLKWRRLLAMVRGLPAANWIGNLTLIVILTSQ